MGREIDGGELLGRLPRCRGVGGAVRNRRKRQQGQIPPGGEPDRSAAGERGSKFVKESATEFVAKGADLLGPQRAGLVRMCVNDILSLERKGETLMPESLAPDLDHPAYLCGRLLAMYDSLQYAAQGDVNVTVADRYYSMASSYPELAFPKLESLSRAHFKKLRRENRAAAVAIERRIDDLMMKLTVFPGMLSLKDQGRFAIG